MYFWYQFKELNMMLIVIDNLPSRIFSQIVKNFFSDRQATYRPDVACTSLSIKHWPVTCAWQSCFCSMLCSCGVVCSVTNAVVYPPNWAALKESDYFSSVYFSSSIFSLHLPVPYQFRETKALCSVKEHSFHYKFQELRHCEDNSM